MHGYFIHHEDDNCRLCGKKLSLRRRRDTKFCSNACRQALHRLRLRRRNDSRRREPVAA
jgi:predicted nucleic acid-binding Zn ribbon protein